MITLTDKEVDMLRAQVELILNTFDNQKMARMGYQLAVMIDTVITMKVINQWDNEQRDNCSCKSQDCDDDDEVMEPVSASIYTQGHDLNEVLNKIMHGIIAAEDDEYV